MQTKRKWLFWIFFGMTILFIIGFGVILFGVLKDKILDASFLEGVKSSVEQKTEYVIINDPGTTVFTFEDVVKIAFYFVFGLFAMVFLFYFYFWLDTWISKLEGSYIDPTIDRYKYVPRLSQPTVQKE